MFASVFLRRFITYLSRKLSISRPMRFLKTKIQINIMQKLTYKYTQKSVAATAHHVDA